MIITIDGPAGAGKSSAARTLARRLGVDFLDTGAMYRAVALAAQRAGIPFTDEPGLTRLVEAIHLDMPPGQVVLDGEDVSGLLRTPEITAASTVVADSPAVRRRLVQWQRQIAARRDVVTEGRDQGTIVFPDACCKFFLEADPTERARRRHRDLVARGQNLTLEEVIHAQALRDERDARRDIAPMVPAKDAIIIDSTRLTMDEVVACMEAEVQKKRQTAPPG